MSGNNVYGDAERVIKSAGLKPEDFDLETEEELESFVEKLLEFTSNRIDRFCNRSFGYHEDFETQFRIPDSDRELKLPHSPIIEIKELKIGGKEITDDKYFVKPNPNNPDLNGGILERDSRYRGWPARRKVEVVYDWGFEEPPGEIKNICEQIVIRYLDEREAEIISEGLQSKSMDGFNVQYDLPSEADLLQLEEVHKERLKPFKNIPIA